MSLLLSLLLSCASAPAPPPTTTATTTAPATAAPTTAAASLYDLDLPLTDQEGRAIGLDVYRGHPTLIAMFYASCPQACPLLIGRVQQHEQGQPEAERLAQRVLLVSLDPTHDDPAALQAVVARHNIDATRWTLARPANDGDVRVLAAALGLAYRAEVGGGFNHASLVTTLDPDGRPTGQLPE